MKTAIIYGSTYGYAEDCAKKLKEQIDGEVVLINAMRESILPIDDFDNIIFGGSIYIGQIQKKINEYCIANVDILLNKRVALFLCCGFIDNFELNLKNSFPEQLINNAIAKECFGGELRIEKMKFLHKMMTSVMKKAAAKEGKEPVKQLTDNITKLAAAINNK